VKDASLYSMKDMLKDLRDMKKIMKKRNDLAKITPVAVDLMPFKDAI